MSRDAVDEAAKTRHRETLLRHAGLALHYDPAAKPENLDYQLLRYMADPDDLGLPGRGNELDPSLRDFLRAAFALDQDCLDRSCHYAFSRLGTEVTIRARLCETPDGMQSWLRLRMVLDVSLDAILAGDMQPYEDTVLHELLARGIEFSFASPS
jgi:hypothetical protein